MGHRLQRKENASTLADKKLCYCNNDEGGGRLNYNHSKFNLIYYLDTLENGEAVNWVL